MKERKVQEYTFAVFGQVQGVMFRRTFVTALYRLGLDGGATNCHQNPNKVICTVIYNDSQKELFNSLLVALRLGEDLNEWGAQILRIETSTFSEDWRKHDVHTHQNNFLVPEGFQVHIISLLERNDI